MFVCVPSFFLVSRGRPWVFTSGARCRLEADFYDPSVSFDDPLSSLSGLDAYRGNVDMLAGRTLMGKILFSDAAIILHDVREKANGQLRTRWTLRVCFSERQGRHAAGVCVRCLFTFCVSFGDTIRRGTHGTRRALESLRGDLGESRPTNGRARPRATEVYVSPRTTD